MSFVFAFIPALLGLFVWMYLLTYFMHQGAGDGFFRKARIGFFRGMAVAGIFILFDTQSGLSGFVGKDWVIFPLIFFLFSLPFSWKRLGSKSLLPFIFAGLCFIVFGFFLEQRFLWSPFHEEIGKWYQSITHTYPALMSPFVSIGFSFVENIRYYMTEVSLAQVLGRNLFSLPLHLFVGLFAFWSFFSLKSRVLGICIGIVGGIAIHTLYNWSLSTSLGITLIIMVAGYAFYGWSLENGWWKKKI